MEEVKQPQTSDVGRHTGLELRSKIMKEYQNNPVEWGAVCLKWFSDMCENMKYVDDVTVKKGGSALLYF